MSTKRVKIFDADAAKWIGNFVKRDDTGKYSTVVTSRVASNGQLCVVRWMSESGLLTSRDDWTIVVFSAVHAGKVGLLTFLHQRGLLDVLGSRIDDRSSPADLDALNGNIGILAWMQLVLGVSGRPENGKILSRLAALRGHLHVLQWLLSVGKLEPTIRDSDGRILSHHSLKLDIARWLHTQGLLNANEKDNEGWTLAHLAVTNGNLELLKWLRDEGILGHLEPTNEGYNLTHLSARQLDIVTWLHAQNLLDTTSKTNRGANLARLATPDVLQWLQEQKLAGPVCIESK